MRIEKTFVFIQQRATLETLDNGKPIRESRDIDVPLVARHFYYHAGMAQLMDEELPDLEGSFSPSETAANCSLRNVKQFITAYSDAEKSHPHCSDYS